MSFGLLGYSDDKGNKEGGEHLSVDETVDVENESGQSQIYLVTMSPLGLSSVLLSG